MKFRDRTLEEIANMICGNGTADSSLFPYRSSSRITRFFADCDTDFRHDGSTRDWWVAQTLATILKEPTPTPTSPPATFCRVISVLMDPGDAVNEGEERSGALAKLNVSLSREGFEAFYGEDRQCYLRHIATKTISGASPNPHRPLSAAELKRKEDLRAYLDAASEDELIEHILLPLFRQLGYSRITAAGHKDKALEYGKDIWMKFTLPTLHVLYFGLQAKIGKIDASGAPSATNANVGELLNQVTMMLGHEIFDPETNRRVLVDHAFIVAGGEITKAARNWLGNKLDATKRSQVLFMDRDDIINLFVVTSLSIPSRVHTTEAQDDDLPF